MRLISLNEKIKLIGSLTSEDLNAWEWDFVVTIKSTARTLQAEKKPLSFSEKQIEVIEKIYSKHF